MAKDELWVGIGYADRLDEFVELQQVLESIFDKNPEYRPAERWAGENDLIQIILDVATYQFFLGMLIERYGGKVLDTVETASADIVKKGLKSLLDILGRHAKHGGEVSFSIPLPNGRASRNFAIHLPNGSMDEVVQAAKAIQKIAPEIDEFFRQYFDTSRYGSPDQLVPHYLRPDGAMLELHDDRGTIALTVTIAPDGAVTSEVRKTF